MGWKTDYRSFYYQGAPEPEDLILSPQETVLLTIDIQNIYMQLSDDPAQRTRWAPFIQRMREVVIPTVQQLQTRFRARAWMCCMPGSPVCWRMGGTAP